ncbi:MAG: rod-binding protein [Nitrospira sp.]|nr:rod-binding protein [Nitrospira sp.]
MEDFATSIYGMNRSLPSLYEMGEGRLDVGRFPDLDRLGQAGQHRAAPVDGAEARRRLIEAGRQFEAYFISYLLKVMRETVPQGSLENKHGAYFHSFYDQEIGIRASEAGGIGIAKMVQQYAENYSAPSPGSSSSFGPNGR